MRTFRYFIGIILIAAGICFWPKDETQGALEEPATLTKKRPAKFEPEAHPSDDDPVTATARERNLSATSRPLDPAIERYLKSQLRLAASSKREFLELRHDDLERVLDLFVDYMIIRTAVEKDIVVEQGVNESGALVLTLAAYPETGAQLKELFYKDIIEQVGEGGAARIESTLGSLIDVHMKYWGLGNQEIKIWRTNGLQAGDHFYLETSQSAANANHTPNPLAPFPSHQSSVVSHNDLEHGIHGVYAGSIKRYQSQIQFPPREPSD